MRSPTIRNPLESPVPHLLTSNFRVPSDCERQSIHVFLYQLFRMRANAQGGPPDLQVEALITQHQALLFIARRVPTHIWRQVLLHHATNRASIWALPNWRAGGVCRAWRNIALTTPELWCTWPAFTHSAGGPLPPPRWWKEVLPLILARAAGRPLYLRIDACLPLDLPLTCASFLSAVPVRTILAAAGELQLTISVANLRSLLTQLGAGTENCRDTDSDREEEGENLPFTFPHLVALTMHLCEQGPEYGEEEQGPAPPHSAARLIARLLSCMPGLRTLEVDHDIGGSPIRTPTPTPPPTPTMTPPCHAQRVCDLLSSYTERPPPTGEYWLFPLLFSSPE